MEKHLDLIIIIHFEENMFVAEESKFNISSQGKTRMEALKNIEEAIEVYFKGEN